MRTKRLLLLLCAVTFVASSCEAPPINRFEVIPQRVCVLGSFVTLEWSLDEGIRGYIDSSSVYYKDDAYGTNMDRVAVTESPTTFTLTVGRGEWVNRQLRVVTQMTGDEPLDLGSGRVTCSPEIGWVYRKDHSDEEGEYPTDARIKSPLINRSAFAVKVVSPYGREVTIDAGNSSDELIGEKFVGVWEITALVTNRRCITPELEPGEPLTIELDTKVGCP